MVRGRVGTSPGWSLRLVALWTLYGVTGAQSPVTAQCAEDVILGCTFPHIHEIKLHRLNITWKMQRAEGVDLLVHSYYGQRDLWQGQDKAYRGRTQLDPEGFAKGNASLKLRSVRIQDEGSYICYVTSELGEWSETTLLTVLNSTAKLPIITQYGEDITLNCSFEPGSNLQLLTITWQKKEAKGPDLLVHSYYNGKDQLEIQDEAYRGRTKLYPDAFSKGNASLRLRGIRLADGGIYTCHVKPQLGRFTTQMKVIVEESPSVLSPWIWLCLLLAIPLLLFLIWKCCSFPLLRWQSSKPLPKPQPSKETLLNEMNEKRLEDFRKNGHQNPSADPPKTPAWDERHTWEKPEQPKFSRGKSPAKEKDPRNIAQKPSKTGQRLDSDRDSADIWSYTFTSDTSDLSEADSAWQEDGGSSQNTMRSVVLLGQTGAGKSSFVNAIRGLGDEEEGAAKTGVVETTMVPTSYQLPKQPNVTIWDLPGFGSMTRQSDMDHYLFSLSQYNVFLIFSSHHFTATHAGLARKIQRAGKKVYFVCSKVDRNLLAARRNRPSTYNEEQILQSIRDTCVKDLQREGVTSPQVFLLSNFEYGRHDFPLLEEILQQELGSRLAG
ncbi:uncharacterized protein LOC117869576 [Trachemys scripta elegans]|uniref:uncharacterized protein LOC117869576 n=1 Tax=Trachemys scripta elegans TaxID=31138 RepID=UPI0015535838|nr:uncharacterized protein LOC117869576 [Trachemys scripta elegans]